MELIIEKSDLNGKINIPASKSAAHRALISACLSEAPSLLKGNFQGRDVEVTAEILQRMGALIERSGAGFRIRPILRKDILNTCFYNKNMDFKIFDTDESGSTLRFLVPISAALGIRAKFVGSGRLSQRPIADLTRALNAHGADIVGEGLPLRICGRLNAGAYEISGDVSSQFISGLLFALPLLEDNSKITVASKVVSAPYIELTRNILADFGVKSEKTKNGFYVFGNQHFVSPSEYEVEGDWSSAAFPFIAGAILGKVRVCGLKSDSAQGDKIIFNLLKDMGADISLSKGGAVTVYKSQLRPIRYSAEQCPDTVPAMCVAAAYANGITEIAGADRLRTKESDRLSACIDMLERASVRAEYREGSLYIDGRCPKAADYPEYKDHRMTMGAAVMSLGAEGQSTIKGAECIEKSYPDFIKDIKKLGGKCREK